MLFLRDDLTTPISLTCSSIVPAQLDWTAFPYSTCQGLFSPHWVCVIYVPQRKQTGTALHYIHRKLLPTSAQNKKKRTMYCLQWLLPVLLIPKPLNPALWFNHSMFMGFYLLSFLLERKPCTICALVFLAALFLICYSCWDNCFLYHCQDAALPDAAHDPVIVGT